MTRDTLSADSLREASRSRAEFSGHGNALGAAGLSTEQEVQGLFLNQTGETIVICPQTHGFGSIRIGAAWDNVERKRPGFFERLLRRAPRQGVDLDLGCLYELADGTRGAVQAFGELYGAYDEPPFIVLSGDEKTGDSHGDDEYLTINGALWPRIKKVLIYVYIYDGAPNWGALRPHIRISVPGEQSMTMVPGIYDSRLPVCVIAGLENVRDAIRMTNHSEYFAGHAEMDRAFGHGLTWATGSKSDGTSGAGF